MVDNHDISHDISKDLPLPPARLPLAVLVRFVATPDNPWQEGSWSVEGVVVSEADLPGATEAVGEARLIHEASGTRIYLSGGFELKLYPDEAESYYQNLMAENPSAFVLCDRLDDGSIRPRQVTLSYAEGTSFTEVEEEVFRVALPPELHRWLEQYVLRHYVPQQKKKRKRDDWKKPDGAPPARLRTPPADRFSS